MPGADSVIPPPLDDDDDDVAWALQTAAVQWNRGGKADAVVWLRRAVDAAIAAGNPARTKELTKLASAVADLLIEAAARAPDSAAPPPRSTPPDEVDSLLDSGAPPPRKSAPRGSSHSLSGEIPIDFSDDVPAEDLTEDLEDDDDAPTIPPPHMEEESASLDESDEPFEEDDTQSVDPSDLLSAPPGANPETWSARPRADSDEAELVGADEVWSHRPDAPPPQASFPPIQPVAPPVIHEAYEPEEPTRSDEDEEAVSSVTVPDAPPLSGPTTDPDPEPLPDSAPEPEPEPESAPEASARGPEPEPERAAIPSEAPLGPPAVDGVHLETVLGFEDLPEETQASLAAAAVLTTLSADEEVSAFGAALVTRGKVGIMPSIADVAAAVAKPGEVVFTQGTLSEGVAVRVVALEHETVVASFTREDLESAFAECPWVLDELKLVADKYQALAGATLGPLGDQLDETMRGLVLSRMQVKSFSPGETIVESGKAVPGLHIVGGGRVELVTGGAVTDESGPGDILFPAEVLSAAKAQSSARAAKSGALVLFAPRSVAAELLTSVPPLIEILAG